MRDGESHRYIDQRFKKGWKLEFLVLMDMEDGRMCVSVAAEIKIKNEMNTKRLQMKMESVIEEQNYERSGL
jgi:hypothetical protein